MDRFQAALPDSVLRELLDHLDVGIQIVDQHGVFLYANDGLVNLAGIPKNLWLGESIYENRTMDICLTDIVLDTKKEATAFQDIVIPQTNRAYRQITTAVPVFDKRGEVVYIISIVEQVPHLERRLQAAQQTRVTKLCLQAGPGDASFGSSEIVSESAQMREILSLCARIADVDSSVLIQGESGTGKEVVAQHLHKCSRRCDKPLVAINCATLPEQLLEAELFGYEKGAFTGASDRGKQGLVEQASSGILFLDEINSMPLSAQGKLLRVLQTKSVRRIGGLKDISVDFRVVVATNQDLYALCGRGEFRSDLLYRLNVIPITLPPLRERPEDILPLTELFLNDFRALYGKVKYFSSHAKRQLLSYGWPGNIRELRNLVERVVVTSDASVVEIQAIPESMFSSPSAPGEGKAAAREDLAALLPLTQEEPEAGGGGLNDYLARCEKAMLERVLEKSRTTYEAARILGISQPSVIRKKKKHGIT